MKRVMIMSALILFLAGIAVPSYSISGPPPAVNGVAGALLGIRVLSGEKKEAKPVEVKSEKKGAKKPVAKPAAKPATKK